MTAYEPFRIRSAHENTPAGFNAGPIPGSLSGASNGCAIGCDEVHATVVVHPLANPFMCSLIDPNGPVSMVFSLGPLVTSGVFTDGLTSVIRSTRSLSHR